MEAVTSRFEIYFDGKINRISYELDGEMKEESRMNPKFLA